MPGAHKKNRPPLANWRSKEAASQFAVAVASGENIEHAANALITALSNTVQRLVSAAVKHVILQHEKDRMHVDAIERRFAELLERQQAQIREIEDRLT
jgi:hypothetical protein